VYGISPANPDPAQVKLSADLQKLLREGFTQRGDQELAMLLSHPDRRARLEAQLELASRGESSVKIFTAVANNKSAAPLARCMRCGVSRSSAARKANVGPTLQKLLADAMPKCARSPRRAWATSATRRRAWRSRNSSPTRKPRVRFFAAQSLGKVGDFNTASVRC
jgi:quinoprotein glucose dehydrogenase